MEQSVNPMRDQIFATPAALQSAFDAMERSARLVLPTPQIYRTRRIVLIGSGDSFIAAKAAELAILEHAEIPIEVRVPMEAGRYQAQLLANREIENTLVIALSNSGEAARVVEAVRLFRARNAAVLALTRNPGSRLAASASEVLPLPALTLPSGPGFGSYLAAQVALLLLGIRFGEVRMSIIMDVAQELRGRLSETFGDLAGVIAATDAPAANCARLIAERPIVEFLGAGPDCAVAQYGAAKLLEAAGRHTYACDLEEWTHLNYFDARPQDIATVLAIAADSRAQSRAVELLAYLHKLGRRVVVVGGGAAAETCSRLGGSVIGVPASRHPLWSPLLLCAPVALLAAHLAAQTGAVYGRGSVGPWEDSADASTVQRSVIMEEPR